MRREVLAFPITALAFVAAVDAVQHAEILGATIALVPKTVVVQIVTLENRRQSQLLAWAIRTTGGPGTGSIVSSSDFTWQVMGPRPDGPIEPGKQRVFEVQLTPGTSSPPSSTLELAVFADGVIDGTALGIARWRNERREHAEDAKYPYGTDRPSGGESMDFCTTDPAARDGRGRIGPGETREFPFSRETADSATLPKVRLRYLLFDDLSFEGRDADRDELLRRREETADDLAFANGVRAALANVSDSDLRDFLQDKKTERIARLLSLKRLPSTYALDRMIEDAARSPARLRETAAAVIAHDEQQRLRLLRHLR
jgi:hypothetical protein